MGPWAMIEAAEGLVRANRQSLTWIAEVGWAAIGLGAIGLAARDRPRGRGAWIAVAAVALAFAVEMAFPHRYELSELLRSALRRVGGGEAIRGRRPIQAAGIAILLVVAAGLMAAFLARRRPIAGAARLAILGTGIGLLGFAVETISLHQIDQYNLVYWSLRYAGLLTAAAGVAWSLAAPAEGHPPRARGPVEPDPPIGRLARLGLAAILLTMPEWVGFLARLIAPAG